jgi:hypothetical protein
MKCIHYISRFTALYRVGVVPQVGNFYPWAVPLAGLWMASEYPDTVPTTFV